MSATEWWWVRHGPTHTGGLAGWTDVGVDLSDTGLIARVSDALPPSAVVVSSDLTRAVLTADAICGGRRRLPNTVGIREIHFGEWEGLSAHRISERWPEVSAKFWNDPNSATPPGGESWSGFAARVSECVDRMTAGLAGGSIVAVAHHGTIASQIGRTEGQDRNPPSCRIPNLSVTRISFNRGRWQLISAPETP